MDIVHYLNIQMLSGAVKLFTIFHHSTLFTVIVNGHGHGHGQELGHGHGHKHRQGHEYRHGHGHGHTHGPEYGHGIGKVLLRSHINYDSPAASFNNAINLSRHFLMSYNDMQILKVCVAIVSALKKMYPY
jgi:hypothetical protein